MRKSHILIVLLSILCLPLSAQTERETESIVLEQGRQICDENGMLLI